MLLLACTGEIFGERPSPATEDGVFTTSPQVRRLTVSEYRSTVEDLFGVPMPTLLLPREQTVKGHGTIAGAQQVGYADVNALLGAAERVAEVAAPVLEGELGPCAASPCRTQWLGGFLERAFRGSVDAVTLERYSLVLESPEAGETQRERLQTLAVAVLSSPEFLYRKEIGVEVRGLRRTLSDEELAARLSYLLWQSGPDATLTAAAREGRLQDPQVRREQLERMMADERFRRGVRALVRDWLDLTDNRIALKSAATLAGTPDTLPAIAEASLDRLIDEVAAPRGGRLADLLTTRTAFADETLAPLFGITATGSSLQRVTLTGPRAGILMQPLVLSAHTKEAGVSPFPIGKFLLQNVTCEEVGSPPASFPTVDEPAGGGQTLRQTLEARTNVSPCVSCHVRIGPPGFAFLPFDPLGRYRATDGAGRAFDTSGSFTFQKSGELVSFADAAELSTRLSASSDVHRCLARRSFRFAYGRFEGRADADAIELLETIATEGQTDLGALLEQLVTSDSFTQVIVNP